MANSDEFCRLYEGVAKRGAQINTPRGLPPGLYDTFNRISKITEHPREKTFNLDNIINEKNGV